MTSSRRLGILEDVEATATKRVIAFQIQQEMRRRRLSKSQMADRMNTSRPQVDRLLGSRQMSL